MGHTMKHTIDHQFFYTNDDDNNYDDDSNYVDDSNDDDDDCLHLRDKGRRNGNRQRRLLGPTALHFMIIIFIIVNVINNMWKCVNRFQKVSGSVAFC